MDLTQIQTKIRTLTEGTVNWGELAENLRTWLIPYEIRFTLFIVVLLVIILVNILFLVRRKKGHGEKRPLRKKYNIPLVDRDIIIIKSNGFISRHKLAVLNVFLLLILVALGVTTFAMKPQVIVTNPLSESYMENTDEVIELLFDIPFNEEELKFNISPDIKGEWVVEPVSLIDPFKRSVKFYPEESIPPNSEVVVYLVGIRQWWQPTGKLHEQSIEFKSPRVPELTETSIKDASESVPVNSVLDVVYDAPIGDFVKIAFQIEPSVEFTVEEIDQFTQRYSFGEPLKQDQIYNAKILLTPRSYNVQTNEDIELGETIEVTNISFTTVTTPFLESFEPKGSAVLPNDHITIIFDQPMDRDSVESKFSITPEVEGNVEWADDRTMSFIPNEPLPKETNYEVKFDVGLASSESGIISEEIKQSFITIGKVKVISTSPVSGTNGHNPKSTNIVVQFDQEVDKASAQSNFAISPAVSGAFSWDGNKMIYSTAGKLGYSRKYSYTMKPGIKSIHGKDSDQSFSYSFNTKANLFSLKIPQYHQQENFTCNIAATRMALAYRGVSVREADVKNAIGIGTNPNSNWVPGYGVHWGPVASYIRRYRNVAVKSGWNTPALAAEVEKGNPVILWWYNRFSQGGFFTLDSGVRGLHGMHSEVVEGFIGDASNPTSIITNDPWRGHQVYSRKTFDATWSYFGKTAVVVY